VVIAQGEIWWAELREPVGSEPGFRRPVLVGQSDDFNRTRHRTTICVPFPSNLAWAERAGNCLLPAAAPSPRPA